MLIVTAKVNRRLILAVAAVAAVLCAAAVAIGLLSDQGGVVSASANAKGIRTNEDRVAYLEGYGWTVSAEPVSVIELIIPDAFVAT